MLSWKDRVKSQDMTNDSTIFRQILGHSLGNKARHLSSCSDDCDFHKSIEINASIQYLCPYRHESRQFKAYSLDININYPGNQDIISYFSNIFDLLTINSCTSCNQITQTRFSISTLPRSLVLGINYRTDISCQQALLITKSFPLFFASTDLFTGKDQQEDEKRNYMLSGFLLSDGTDFVRLVLSEKRVWEMSGKYTNMSISLFDCLINLLPEGFFPLMVLYQQNSYKPYPILADAWTCIEKRISTIANIWTCRCGVINENKQCCCNEINNVAREGWKCECGSINLFTQCNCGKGIYKCYLCRNYGFSKNHCKKCRVQDRVFCTICRSAYDDEFIICKRCMNPSAKVFDGYAFFPNIQE